MSDPLDELYRLPLAEFTRARNQLADAAGDRQEAARIRKLAKPSVVAWAVNQVYHRHRELFDALLAAAAEVASSQAAGDPEPLRASMKERREALDACVAAAAGELEAAGHGTSPGTMQKVARSLEALATWGEADGAPPAGRLSGEVEPPGFDVLAQLAASAPPPRARSRTPKKPGRTPTRTRADERRAELEEALREAEAAISVRAAEHARALEARERAHDRARTLAAKVEEAAARLAELEEKQASAQREHRDARAAARRAATAEARAKDRLARAKKKLDDLG